MAYGFEIKNNSNKTVFSTEDQFFSALSLNYLSYTNSTPVYNYHIFYEWPHGGGYIKPTGTVYWHDIPYTSNNKRVIHFIKVPVGSWLVPVAAVSGNKIRYFSDQSTLAVVYAQRAKDMNGPTSSYGVICYNANGDICYNPDHPLVHIQGSVNNDNISSEWYSLQNVRQAASYNGGWRFGNAAGILRTSSTTIYRFLFGFVGSTIAGPEMSYQNFGIHADIDISTL